jgi:hypothetical protein
LSQTGPGGAYDHQRFVKDRNTERVDRINDDSLRPLKSESLDRSPDPRNLRRRYETDGDRPAPG